MVQRLIGCLLGGFVAITLLSNNASALSYPSGKLGQDVSWPNCGSLHFSPGDFGIVGVTGGLSFHNNVCIEPEAALYKQNLSLYVNSGFPGAPYDLKYDSYPLTCKLTNITCMAYDYGYNSGTFAVNYALREGIVSTNWWIDIEADNSWTDSVEVNRNSLIGELNAISESSGGASVGFYAYPTQWDDITGNWHTGDRVWQATDRVSLLKAEHICKLVGFSGQKPILTQFLNSSQTLDIDLSC